MLDMKRKVGHPFISNKEGESHETSEVNCNLPPRFDEYEEQEDDDDKGACEGFIILGGQQKFELMQVEIIQGLER